MLESQPPEELLLVVGGVCFAVTIILQVATSPIT